MNSKYIMLPNYKTFRTKQENTVLPNNTTIYICRLP